MSTVACPRCKTPIEIETPPSGETRIACPNCQAQLTIHASSPIPHPQSAAVSIPETIAPSKPKKSFRQEAAAAFARVKSLIPPPPPPPPRPAAPKVPEREKSPEETALLKIERQLIFIERHLGSIRTNVGCLLALFVVIVIIGVLSGLAIEDHFNRGR